MRKRIKAYMAYIDRLLENNDSGLSYEELCAEHEKQLAFFMHERQIHLLVTLAFAIFVLGTFAVAVLQFSPGMLALFIAFVLLLIPYIIHYYFLEHSVQRMYRQYDRLQQRIHPGAFGMEQE